MDPEKTRNYAQSFQGTDAIKYSTTPGAETK